MKKIVKIIEPKTTFDTIYYRSVSVEYDNITYIFHEVEGDNGTDYFCSINDGSMVEINWEFENEIAKELCEKVFEAYREGIVEDDTVCEFSIN